MAGSFETYQALPTTASGWLKQNATKRDTANAPRPVCVSFASCQTRRGVLSMRNGRGQRRFTAVVTGTLMAHAQTPDKASAAGPAAEPCQMRGFAVQASHTYRKLTEFNMAVLVGKEAPDFKVQAVKSGEIIDNFTLSQFKGQKYVVLFFYPLDFTFVCPTELHEFQAHAEHFAQLGAEVVGCSVDSPHSHTAWLKTPKKQGGIEGVKYPIVADLNKTVAQSYDVLLPAGMALRATFIIDKKGVVQAQLVNNLDLGRNVEEIVRLLEALQYTEEHGEVCQAAWKKGSKGMKATQEGVRKHFGG